MREAMKQDQPSSAHPPTGNSAANKPGFNNHHRAAPKFPHTDAAAVAPAVPKSNNSQSDKGPDHHISSGSYAKSHHLPLGGAAPGLSSGDGVSKSSTGSLSGYTSLLGKVDVIPGLDFTGDPMSHDTPEVVPSAPAVATAAPSQDGTRMVHTNLAMMLQMLQSNVGGQNKLSIDELAATLKVPIDANTRTLLENLSGQLLVATKPSDQPRSADPGLDRNALEAKVDHYYDASSSSHPYQPPDGAMCFSSTNHDLEACGGMFTQQPASDENAGIKAALAQLLTQKGITVKLGAKSFVPSSNPGAMSPKATRLVSDRGDGTATKGSGLRGERLYSQQTSYGSQMSISEGNSNSPPVGGNFHPSSLGGGALAPPAETMSVRAKVQSFFEKSDQPQHHQVAPQKPTTSQPHIFPIVGHSANSRLPSTMSASSYLGRGGTSAPRGILKGNNFQGTGSKGRGGM